MPEGWSPPDVTVMSNDSRGPSDDSAILEPFYLLTHSGLTSEAGRGLISAVTAGLHGL